MPGEQSRINGRKGGMPEVKNPLAGLTNLDTGHPAPVYRGSASYANMKAAANALGIDIYFLKEAKNKGCPAFGNSCAVHKARLAEWFKLHPPQTQESEPVEDENDFQEDYTTTDEAGGVGQTLKSLQVYERRLKKTLDDLERNKSIPKYEKDEKLKTARANWLRFSKLLLDYDTKVALAKRDAGELLPLAEAQQGVQNLLAWLTVATSDALRNCIPDCVGKDQYQIAAILDPALRDASFRNFKMGERLGKIPDWMCKTATKFIQERAPLGEKSLEEQLDEY